MCEPMHSGHPVQLAVADWLQELAVFGSPRHPIDAELAHHLSLAVENWYLVQLALARRV